MTPDPRHLKKRFWWRMVFLSIAGILLPPLLGLIGTVTGMMGAFGELSEAGAADPAALSGHVSTSLMATAVGLGISVLSAVFLVVAAIRLSTLPKGAAGSKKASMDATPPP